MSFRLKTYQEILDNLKTFLVAKTGIKFPFIPGDVVLSLLEVAAYEDAEQYLQMFNLLQDFSIDTLSGEGLDRRALDFGLIRIPAQKASGVVRFYYDTTDSFYWDDVNKIIPNNVEIRIPKGTVVQTLPRFYEAPIRYTTIEDKIFNFTQGTTESQLLKDSEGIIIGDINVVCQEAGGVGNVSEDKVVELLSPISGVLKVRNPLPMGGGREAETDEEFKIRIKTYWSSLTRGTVESLKYAISLAYDPTTNKKVVSYDIVEDFFTGTVFIYIDDGTGMLIEAIESNISYSKIVPEDNMMYMKLPHIAIITGSVEVRKNGILIPENPEYDGITEGFWVDYPRGILVFQPLLRKNDNIEVQYSRYTGLIEIAQKIIFDYKPAGIMVFVLPANISWIDVKVEYEYLIATMAKEISEIDRGVERAVQDYFIRLKIGENIKLSIIIDMIKNIQEIYAVKVSVKYRGEDIYRTDDLIIEPGYLARLSSLIITSQGVEIL